MSKDVKHKYALLPPGAFFTEISGWHRVRIATPNTHNEEIGCGNSQHEAAEEAWEWWFKIARRALEGKCPYCGGEPVEWEDEYESGKAPPCYACEGSGSLYEKEDDK